MSAIAQTVRDNALYYSGFIQGRSHGFPTSFSQLYGSVVARASSFLSLPLPVLSFLALPVFGGSSTTVSVLFAWATWTSIIFTHDPLHVEAYGTFAVRLLFFLLPAFGFLGFDLLLPGYAQSMKAYGEKQVPNLRDRKRILKIAGVATFNVLLAIALQAILEVFTTDVLHNRSLLRVSSMVPLPWNMAKDVLKGLVVRGVLHYFIHRYVLHTYRSYLRTWHLQWQHSARLPFGLVAAYDHPICYLLATWLPTYAPAYLFRFHVLTWHIFVVLTSLGDLFVYSGYAVLPSSIVLAGMARRTDAHFLTTQRGDVCNFSHTGLLDLIFGTTCKDTTTLAKDLEDETREHHIGERAQRGARGAARGVIGTSAADDDAASDNGSQDYLPTRDQTIESNARSPVKRKSARNRPQ